MIPQVYLIRPYRHLSLQALRTYSSVSAADAEVISTMESKEVCFRDDNEGGV